MNVLRAVRFFGAAWIRSTQRKANRAPWSGSYATNIPRPTRTIVTSNAPGSPWRTRYQQARAQQQTRGYRQQMFNRGRTMGAGYLKRWAQRPTFYYEVAGLSGVCGVWYIYNLDVVPVSGRRRFNCLSPETEKWLGQLTLDDLVKQYRGRILPENSREHRMVECVMERLIPYAGLPDEQWEVRVIKDDEQMNAFVLPGGKVFIFTGMMKFCRDEDGLAAVLGHEIAHNVAHHAGEQASRSLVLLPIGILAFFVGGIDPSLWRLVTNLAFTLPGSRKQEEEADYIGLLMMSEGCYDPRAALRLWASMEKAEQGKQPPQMLSTHPSHHARLEKIQNWLPEANDKRQMSDCAATGWHMNRFKEVADLQRW